MAAIGQDFFFLSGFATAYRKASLLAAARADKSGEDKFVRLAAGVEEEQKLHQVRLFLSLCQSSVTVFIDLTLSRARRMQRSGQWTWTASRHPKPLPTT